MEQKKVIKKKKEKSRRKNDALNKKEKFRLFVQACVTVVSNGYIAGFAQMKIYKRDLKKLCVPGLNCYSCPGALGSCPIGALQAVLGNRQYHIAFYVLGFLMMVGAVFGRFICGWACPFGLVQDLLHKIPTPKKWKKLPGDRVLRYLKYVLLVVFVILMPLYVVDFVGQGEPWFCKLICPVGTLEGGIPLVSTSSDLQQMVGFLFAWKNLILIGVIVLAIFVYRPFCHYVCPLGVIYGLFNPIAFTRFKVDKKTCTNCKACKNVCKLDIPVYEKPNSVECIRCGMCMSICPESAIQYENAIRRKHVKKNDCTKA